MGRLPFYKVSQASSLSHSLAIDPLTSTCKNGNKQKKMDTHTLKSGKKEKKKLHTSLTHMKCLSHYTHSSYRFTLNCSQTSWHLLSFTCIHTHAHRHTRTTPFPVQEYFLLHLLHLLHPFLQEKRRIRLVGRCAPHNAAGGRSRTAPAAGKARKTTRLSRF